MISILWNRRLKPSQLNFLCFSISLVLLFALGESYINEAYAQTSQGHSSDVISASSKSREDMQQHYVDERARGHSLFFPAPYFHIVPQKNMITATAAVTYLDVTIVPKYEKVKDKTSDNDHYLHQSGWEAGPMVGFSADRFGIGFASEFGQKEATYHVSYLETDGSTSWWEQNSKIKYSGLGLYLYWLPEARFLPNYIDPTFIAGYKGINVVHSYASRNSQVKSDYKDYRYQVKKLDYGFNLSINLAKYFRVIPWLNYTNRLIEPPKNGDSSEAQNVEIDLIADQSFFWDSTPRYLWGVDFAIIIGKFDLHLGGAFGLIDSLAKGSDRINESNISLTATYNIRAR